MTAAPLPAEKLCSRCDTFKALDQFSPHKNGLFGRYSHCRACAAEIGRARYVPKPKPKRQPVPEGQKRCCKCLKAKPVVYFGKDGRKRDGLRSACLACAARESADSQDRNREASTKRAREWSRANADKQRAARLWRLYKITPERFDEILASQGGGCALCGHVKTTGRWDRLAVDHDHACCPGKTSCGQCVRGILCGRCNTGVGLLEVGGADALTKAHDYVERHRRTLKPG